MPLLSGWLRAMWLLAATARAAPRRRRLALTVLGALFASTRCCSRRRSRGWRSSLVLLSVLCDGLDGAVALLSRRVSVAGGYADKIADRVADAAFAAVLWRCGAPWGLALAAGALSLAHEAIRTVRGGALLARLTVAERPTRTICAALACGSSAVSSATWPPTVCAAVWTGLALIGLAQLR